MPRQRQPKSMREASLTSIVSNFDNFWPAGQFMAITSAWSPFQYLADDMIQEMIDMLDKRKLLKKYHFHLLLHDNIRRLNLSVCSSLPSQKFVIKALRARCQKLTHLKISLQYNRHQEDVYCELLCALLGNLPELISLQLNHTEMTLTLNAKVLTVISESCPNLLDLKWFVRNLRDKDFCNSPTYPKDLPKLRNMLFSLGDPSVDILVHLLNCHPGLRYISVPVDHAFEQLYGEEFQSPKRVPPEVIHNLLDIEIERSSGGKFNLSENDRLDLTFQCCPFLTKLNLKHLEDPESIENVSTLKHLTHLSVFIGRQQQEKFSTHMSSVLTEIGHNLISLHCSGFYRVRLIIIGKLCPKLEHLKLDMNEFLSEHDLLEDYVSNPFPCFTNLKVIYISIKGLHKYFDESRSQTFIDKEALSLLLQNASKITEMRLSTVNNLTDQIISSSHQKHCFRHLKECKFIGCSSISVESIWTLFYADNPLEYLEVDGCRNITAADMDLVKLEAFQRNFSITIDTGLIFW